MIAFNNNIKQKQQQQHSYAVYIVWDSLNV